MSNFALRVVSAEFQTNRREAHHYRTPYKLPLPDSYLYNLPSSANSKKNSSKQRIFPNKKPLEKILWENEYISDFFLA
jgi:hypothetical protein